MNDGQNLNEVAEVSDAIKEKLKAERLLKFQQELYIDYLAVGGFITKENGEITRMTVAEFAEKIEVSVQTLYNWRESIPNFWDRVNTRRRKLGSEMRVQRVWAGLYLKAAAGNPKAAAIFLANHDKEFRMPTEKVEHELGNTWASLVRKKSQTLEGEVVDGSGNDQPG